MKQNPSPRSNHLIACLPEEIKASFFAQLETVELKLGQVIYEPGDEMSYVYFPTTAIVSMLYVMESGSSAEIAVVGNDGIVGIAVFMGGISALNRGVVQSEGSAYRMSATKLRAEFNKHGALMILLLRYTQALITQMSLTAVCNRHHSIVQQLCRWLLLSLDRLEGNKLNMTQELIADMLGVRREGVTVAAGALQKQGVIRYYRGRIEVLNRPKLESISCECYAAVKTETDRLMPYWSKE